jgi:hypothetical protein
VGKNEERARYPHFTNEVLFLEEYLIFQHKDSKRAFDPNFKNLKNIRIVTQRGYQYGGKIQPGLDQGLFGKVKAIKDIPQLLEVILRERFEL